MYNVHVMVLAAVVGVVAIVAVVTAVFVLLLLFSSSGPIKTINILWHQ